MTDLAAANEQIAAVFGVMAAAVGGIFIFIILFQSFSSFRKNLLVI